MRLQSAHRNRLIGAVALAAALAVAPSAQERASAVARALLLDETLDLYVRDGYVYYRALKSDRSRLDRYVGALETAAVDSASRDEQMAFWLNAYNALVLRTVIDNYPIVPRSRDYPRRSIRQIPGAFERLPHRVAGRTVTLDQIEQTILPAFRDPRLYLALGRGAVGSGRLRSEAFGSAAIERQLTETANECASRAQCLNIDRAANKVQISSIFSWRQSDFASAYAGMANDVFGARSPIERAVIALVSPRLLMNERELLAKNDFEVEYLPFDWTLNDLAGR